MTDDRWNQRGVSESEEDMALSARDQRALARNVRQLNDTMGQNSEEVNRALRALQGQMRQQVTTLRTEMNPIPGLAPSIARELEPFDGRLGTIFTDWLERFIIVSEAQSWNNARKCHVLPAFLRGAALQAWRGLTDRDKEDFERLRERLIEILQPAYATRFIQNEFTARKQRPDERVIEFAYELERLAKAGYPNMPEGAREEFLLSNFIDKLNPQVRSLVMIWDPQTFEEARTKAQQVEATQKYTQNSVAVNMLANPIVPLQTDAHLFEMGVSPSETASKDSAVLFEMGKISEKLEKILNQSKMSTNAPSFQDFRQESYRPRSYSASTGPRFPNSAPNFQRDQRQTPPPYVERNTFTHTAKPTCFRCGAVGHIAVACGRPRQDSQVPARSFGYQNGQRPAVTQPPRQQYQGYGIPITPPGQYQQRKVPTSQMNAMGPNGQFVPQYHAQYVQNSNPMNPNPHSVSGYMDTQSLDFLPSGWPGSASQMNLLGAVQPPLPSGLTAVNSNHVPVPFVSGYPTAPVASSRVVTGQGNQVSLEVENHALRTENARLAATILPQRPEVDSGQQATNLVLECGHTFQDWYALPQECRASVVCPNEHVVLYRDVCFNVDCCVEFCGTCQHQKGCSRCRIGSFQDSPPILPTPLEPVFTLGGDSELPFVSSSPTLWPLGQARFESPPVNSKTVAENSDIADAHFRFPVEHGEGSERVQLAVLAGPDSACQSPCLLQPEDQPTRVHPPTEAVVSAASSTTVPAVSAADQGTGCFVAPLEVCCPNAELLGRVNENLWIDELVDLEVAQLVPSDGFQPIQPEVSKLCANMVEVEIPSNKIMSNVPQVFVQKPLPVHKPLAGVSQTKPVAPIDCVLANVDAMLYGQEGPVTAHDKFGGVARNLAKQHRKQGRYECRDPEQQLHDPHHSSDEDKQGRPAPSTAKRSTLLLPYYVAVLAVLCHVLGVTGKSGFKVADPLVCHASDTRATWRLPDALPCAPDTSDKVSEPQQALLAIYKRNYIQYKVSAWLCKKVTQTVSVKSWVFNDEHLKKETTKLEPIDMQECEQIVRFKKCSVGPMVEKGGLLQTENKLDWDWTHGFFECCRWKTYEATNCFAFKTIVLKRHGNGMMESPAGVVSHCDYNQGHCTLSDSTLLTWVPDTQERCEFIVWQSIEGTQRGNSFVSADGNLALTTINAAGGEQHQDCHGKSLIMSDQGVPFRRLRVWHQNNQVAHRIKRLAHQDVVVDLNKASSFGQTLGARTWAWRRQNRTAGVVKLRRARQLIAEQSAANGPDSNGIVLADTLAMALQALEFRLQENIRFAFDHAVSATCQNMNAILQILSASILGNPTVASRFLLNRSDIVARASMQALEISACHELPSGDFHFKPMPKYCTRELPIAFKISGKNLSGYFDPLTNVIHSSGTPEDCALSEAVPVQLKNKSFLYHKDGKLTAVNWYQLPSLPWPVSNFSFLDLHLESTIFHRIIMYNLSEFQGHSSMNDLLSAVHQHRRIFEALGVRARRLGDDDEDADEIASRITKHGFFGFLYGLNVSWWQLWVFMVCLKVTLSAVVWCCCPFKVLHTSTPATYLAERLQQYRQWRQEHQLLSQSGSSDGGASMGTEMPQILVTSSSLPASTPTPRYTSTPCDTPIDTTVHTDEHEASTQSRSSSNMTSPPSNNLILPVKCNDRTFAISPLPASSSSTELATVSTPSSHQQSAQVHFPRSSPMSYHVTDARIHLDPFNEDEREFQVNVLVSPSILGGVLLSKMMVYVQRQPVIALLDTGSDLTLVPAALIPDHYYYPTTIQHARTLTGNIPILGITHVEIGFGSHSYRRVFQQKVFVVHTLFLGHECILGQILCTLCLH